MTVVRVASPNERRQCPKCFQHWPQQDPRLLLAGFGWLDGLPRRISPNNIDCAIHDGGWAGGARRNRFLMLEVKRRDEEPWNPIQTGQARALMGLTEKDGIVVRILRGDVDDLSVHRVTRTSIDYDGGIRTTATRFHRAVTSWLAGRLWRDVEEGLSLPIALKPEPPAPPVGPRCPTCREKPIHFHLSDLSDSIIEYTCLGRHHWQAVLVGL